MGWLKNIVSRFKNKSNIERATVNGNFDRDAYDKMLLEAPDQNAGSGNRFGVFGNTLSNFWNNVKAKIKEVQLPTVQTEVGIGSSVWVLLVVGVLVFFGFRKK